MVLNVTLPLLPALTARGALLVLLLAAAPARASEEQGTLAVVNLAWDRPAPADAVAGRLTSLVGGWARDPRVARELLGHLTGPVQEPPPSMGELLSLLHRIRDPERPPCGADLSRLGRLLAVDYLVIVHRRNGEGSRRVRVSLYSVNLQAMAPRQTVVRLPDLGGLNAYLRAETSGGGPRRQWCPTCRLRWTQFTLEHLRQASLRVAAGTWLKRIGGYAQLETDARLPDDRVNLVTDLGLDQSYTFVGRLEYQPWNRHRFRFGYTPSHYSGRVIMDHAARLDQKLIPVHELIETDVDMDFYELSYWYDVLRRSIFVLSVGVEIKICDAHFYLKDLGNVVTGGRIKEEAVETRQTYPVPYLAARVEFFPLRMLGFVGEVKGSPRERSSPTSTWSWAGRSTSSATCPCSWATATRGSTWTYWVRRCTSAWTDRS